MSYSPINKHLPSEDSNIDDNYLYTSSAYDMTGLTPTVAHDEYEAQSYQELYPYLPPVQPNPTAGDVPSVANGIHVEYRTHVTKQHHDK